MENWEKALNKFLENWKGRKEVIGAIVTGSYIIGTNKKFSDIDVHIILSDKVRWRERGNKRVGGFLIEYFANPIRQLKKYREEDYREGVKTDIRMFAIGRILFDKTGIVKKLQNQAKKELKKSFLKPKKNWTELSKYTLWDQLKNLRDLEIQSKAVFDFAYYIFLDRSLKIYSQFLGAELLPYAKLYDFFTNDNLREKYQINNFPDQKFKREFIKCIEKPSLAKIEVLINYILIKMGGFNIDGWKLRSDSV